MSVGASRAGARSSPMESNFLAATALAFTGCGLAMVSGSLFPHDPEQALLASISSFGVVHVPAACILLLKRAQHSGR